MACGEGKIDCTSVKGALKRDNGNTAAADQNWRSQSIHPEQTEQ